MYIFVYINFEEIKLLIGIINLKNFVNYILIFY